jgi:hypothetical protein
LSTFKSVIGNIVKFIVNLFSLYGIASIFSATRKLHAENQELKIQLQITEQRADERVSRLEAITDDRTERLLAKQGVTPKARPDEEKPVTVRRAPSRIKAAQAKTLEREVQFHNLYNRERSQPLHERVADESVIDESALLSGAAQAVSV